MLQGRWASVTGSSGNPVLERIVNVAWLLTYHCKNHIWVEWIDSDSKTTSIPIENQTQGRRRPKIKALEASREIDPEGSLKPTLIPTWASTLKHP